MTKSLLFKALGITLIVVAAIFLTRTAVQFRNTTQTRQHVAQTTIIQLYTCEGGRLLHLRTTSNQTVIIYLNGVSMDSHLTQPQSADLIFRVFQLAAPVLVRVVAPASSDC